MYGGSEDASPWMVTTIYVTTETKCQLWDQPQTPSVCSRLSLWLG